MIKRCAYRRLHLTQTQLKIAMKFSSLTIVSLLGACNAFAPSATSFSRGLVQRNVVLEGREITGEVEPCSNFILVKVYESEKETEGGIILSQKAQVKKTEGFVVSTGPGRTHQESGILFEMPVKSGDSVLYGKYDGTEIDYDGSKHMLIRDTDIMVKYNGDKLTLDSAEMTSDSILVKVNRSGEEETSSGLLIASTANKGKASTGEVIRVGPGRMAANGEFMTVDVSVGDFVKFRDFAGNEVTIEKEDYAVVRFPDVLAKY